MSNPEILDFSQRNSENVISNGDYKIQLPKTVYLPPNKSISIRNVYIDTVTASEQNIILEKDVKLTVHNGVYLLDHDSDLCVCIYTC